MTSIYNVVSIGTHFVYRVPGGWLYQNRGTVVISVFVPYHEEFRGDDDD